MRNDILIPHKSQPDNIIINIYVTKKEPKARRRTSLDFPKQEYLSQDLAVAI